jgi:hypothetical protein
MTGRKGEVLEGTTHEDAGGADARVQGATAVDDEYVMALRRQQPRGVQTGKAGADDEYVHDPHSRRR